MQNERAQLFLLTELEREYVLALEWAEWAEYNNLHDLDEDERRSIEHFIGSIEGTESLIREVRRAIFDRTGIWPPFTQNAATEKR